MQKKKPDQILSILRNKRNESQGTKTKRFSNQKALPEMKNPTGGGASGKTEHRLIIAWKHPAKK